jgi:hypothetical protein
VNYRLVIEGAVLADLLASAPKERRLLADSFARLVATPFAEPDFKEVVAGREVLVRFFGQFAVTYWLDHAVKEVRIVNFFRD